MLTDTQLECIELLCQGIMTNKEIANSLNITDRVIYKWKNNDEFKRELDKRSSQFSMSIKDEGRMRMISKGQTAIDNIVKIANTAKSEKVKLEANTFIYEAIFGKPTTKIESTTNETNNDQGNKELSWDNIKHDEGIKLKVVKNT
ncbi:MAG: phBC6A51 family helix-turn-helix protein [Sarcina sp.]